jgi:hypothetical protein
MLLKAGRSRRRGLSNDSINKVLRAIRAVLKDAVKRRLIGLATAIDVCDGWVRLNDPSRVPLSQSYESRVMTSV